MERLATQSSLHSACLTRAGDRYLTFRQPRWTVDPSAGTCVGRGPARKSTPGRDLGAYRLLVITIARSIWDMATCAVPVTCDASRYLIRATGAGLAYRSRLRLNAENYGGRWASCGLFLLLIPVENRRSLKSWEWYIRTRCNTNKDIKI